MDPDGLLRWRSFCRLRSFRILIAGDAFQPDAGRFNRPAFQAAPRTRDSATTSSVTTRKLLSHDTPKDVVIATSAASRPVAIRTRPIRGALLRASKVHHLPPR